MPQDRDGNELRYQEIVAVPDFLLNGERRPYVQGRFILQQVRGPKKGQLLIEINRVEVYVPRQRVVAWRAFTPKGGD